MWNAEKFVDGTNAWWLKKRRRVWWFEVEFLGSEARKWSFSITSQCVVPLFADQNDRVILREGTWERGVTIQQGIH